jgi:hypothetical protein
MRALATACLIAVVSCSTSATTGEQLPTPFPGSVLSATPERHCGRSRCLATYRVKITNPTDRDAYVQDCAVSPPVPGLDRLPIMGIAGLSVLAGRTSMTTARFTLPVGRHEVVSLAGRTLACTGIDWHGSPPI